MRKKILQITRTALSHLSSSTLYQQSTSIYPLSLNVAVIYPIMIRLLTSSAHPFYPSAEKANKHVIVGCIMVTLKLKGLTDALTANYRLITNISPSWYGKSNYSRPIDSCSKRSLLHSVLILPALKLSGSVIISAK